MINTDIKKTKSIVKSSETMSFFGVGFLVISVLCLISAFFYESKTMPLIASIIILFSSLLLLLGKKVKTASFLQKECDPYAYLEFSYKRETKRNLKSNLLIEGVASFYMGDFQRSIHRFERLLSEFKLNEKTRFNVYLLLCYNFFFLENFEESLKYLEMFKQSKTKDGEFLVSKIVELFISEKYEEASQYIDECLNSHTLKINKENRNKLPIVDLKFSFISYLQILCLKKLGEEERIKDNCCKILEIDNKTFMAIESRKILYDLKIDDGNLPKGYYDVYACPVDLENKRFVHKKITVKKRYIVLLAIAVFIMGANLYASINEYIAGDTLSVQEVQELNSCKLISYAKVKDKINFYILEKGEEPEKYVFVLTKKQFIGSYTISVESYDLCAYEWGSIQDKLFFKVVEGEDSNENYMDYKTEKKVFHYKGKAYTLLTAYTE